MNILTKISISFYLVISEKHIFNVLELTKETISTAAAILFSLEALVYHSFKKLQNKPEIFSGEGWTALVTRLISPEALQSSLHTMQN